MARSGNPAKALELLEPRKVSDTAPDAALHHFTVGSLYLETGNPGRALAHLEKSRALANSNPEVESNLTLARMRAEASAGKGSLEKATLAWEGWAQSAVFFPCQAGVTLLALGFALQLWQRRRARGGRRTLGALAVVTWGVALSFAGLQVWTSARPPARALMETPIRSGPGEDFIILAHAAPGAELRTLPSAGEIKAQGWTHVRLNPDVSGWAETRNLLLITRSSNKSEQGGLSQ
jgi:hypothetical protein